MASTPADHLHVFPGFHGVMAEHASLALRNRWMGSHPAVRTQDDPLAMSGWVVIAESHQQLFSTIRQPAFPFGLRWGFVSGAVTIRHCCSLAVIRFDLRQRKASGEVTFAVDQQASGLIELAHLFEQLRVVHLWFWSKPGGCHGCLRVRLTRSMPARSCLEGCQPSPVVRFQDLSASG